MINVFFCTSSHQLDAALFRSLLGKLPAFLQNQVLRFRNWEDRQRSLFGKLLLKHAISSPGYNEYSLDQLKFTELRRPYFDDRVDFNISHSGDYILCGITKTGKLGLDIEKITEIPLDDFDLEFSRQEMDSIINSPDSVRSFYDLWTKKEAFLKVIGTGLHTPLNRIKVEKNKVVWNGQDWFLKELNLDGEYVAHLCTDLEDSTVITSEMLLS